MADLSYSEALAEAGAIAATMLEIRDPAQLAIVTMHASAPAIALAIVTVQSDPQWAQRWAEATAAGDWNAQGAILHEAIVWLLTPEAGS